MKFVEAVNLRASKGSSKPCQPLNVLLDCPAVLCQNGQKTGELLCMVIGNSDAK